MSRRRHVARYIAVTVGGLLCGVGVLHDVVNIKSVRRAIAHGEISERLGAQLIANVAMAGVALALLGSFLLLAAADLGRGKRLAWRVALMVGIVLILSGLAGYWWQPIPRVLIFTVVGLVLTAPLLLWRKHFVEE